MDRVIIFVDVVKSTASKIKLGDAEANRMIAKRLSDVEADFRVADPTIERQAPSAGDEILLLGSDPVALFLAAVISQGKFRALAVGPAVYISLGLGEFDIMPDGKYVSLRGSPLDLTHRIMEFCPEAGIVVTESLRPKVQAAGFAGKLIRLEADIEGFGVETYYEADGEFVRSVGSRLPAVPLGGPVPTSPTIGTTYVRAPFVVPGAEPGALPREGKTPAKSQPIAEPRNGFWRVFAIVGLAVAVATIAVTLWLSL